MDKEILKTRFSVGFGTIVTAFISVVIATFVAAVYIVGISDVADTAYGQSNENKENFEEFMEKFSDKQEIMALDIVEIKTKLDTLIDK